MENNDNEKLLEGDIGGAVCTADDCIGDFAPENVCVATDITPKRKKIDEFFNKLEVQMKNLKEGKEPEPIDYVGEFEFPESNKYIRKFSYGDQVRYPGDEEYVNLKTSWQEKRKPIHDKKVMPRPFSEEPNMTSRIRKERNLYSTFDDGREDDFLAWYEDHKKETEKPVLKESEERNHLSETLKTYDEDYDEPEANRLYLVAVDHNSILFEGLLHDFIDAHGYVDDYDAFVLPDYEIEDIFDNYSLEAQDYIKVYELPEKVYESEDTEFHVSKDELEDASWRF